MTANELAKRLRDRYSCYTAVPLETLLLQAAEAIEDLTRQVTELREAQGEPAALSPPDLHTPGIYVVLDADGAPVLETLALTGYSARATFIREKNKCWSKAQAEGYRIVELVPR